MVTALTDPSGTNFRQFIPLSPVRWTFALLAIPLVIMAVYQPSEDRAELYLENSVPYIGASPPDGGLGGDGILVAVIDTGIDHMHPDLFGFGTEGKIVGGYNFVDPSEQPIDYNGHGTQVAGIIAANGQVRGVAPEAKILAYKVSEDGDGVRPDLIVRAISMAVRDGADIINISLGVNKTSERIDQAVSQAVREGVLVVAAAGNDGPLAESIGSPGRNPAALTVGATYNNLTSSQVATLEVNGISYVVIPMVDSVIPEDPIVGPVVFGGYAREQDLAGIDVSGTVLLAERGSDIPGEMIYFSTKESNAADAGAAAAIVFNNEDGIFFGELVHQFVESGYEPRIPMVSMSREDGLKIMDTIQDGAQARLRLFYNPDHPVQFSSRGPVSPSYIKPDMMAPGAYINTTSISGYNVTSGTSYAAPHVSGAAALLLQKHPDLSVEEIRSVLTTTATAVTDETNKLARLADAGSGRLDVGAALSTDLVVLPPAIVASITAASGASTVPIQLRSISGTLGQVEIEYDAPDMRLSHSVAGDILLLTVESGEDGAEGRLTIRHKGISHSVPILLHRTDGTVNVVQDGGTLTFRVSHPDGWSFAKITVIGRNGDTFHASATPDDAARISVYENGTYYVQADIVAESRGSVAYDTVTVDSVPRSTVRPQGEDMPWRSVGIVAAMAGVVGVVGMMVRFRGAGRRL